MPIFVANLSLSYPPQVYCDYGTPVGFCHQWSIRKAILGDVTLAIYMPPLSPKTCPPIISYSFHASFSQTGVQRLFHDQLDFPAFSRANYVDSAGVFMLDDFLQNPTKSTSCNAPELFMDVFLEESDITLNGRADVAAACAAAGDLRKGREILHDMQTHADALKVLNTAYRGAATLATEGTLKSIMMSGNAEGGDDSSDLALSSSI